MPFEASVYAAIEPAGPSPMTIASYNTSVGLLLNAVFHLAAPESGLYELFALPPEHFKMPFFHLEEPCEGDLFGRGLRPFEHAGVELHRRLLALHPYLDGVEVGLVLFKPLHERVAAGEYGQPALYRGLSALQGVFVRGPAVPF